MEHRLVNGVVLQLITPQQWKAFGENCKKVGEEFGFPVEVEDTYVQAGSDTIAFYKNGEVAVLPDFADCLYPVGSV